MEKTLKNRDSPLRGQSLFHVCSANRLVYIFEGNLTSRFEFKVQLESPAFYPKKGEIRYRIGIGMRQSRLTSPSQILIFYGEWKFGRDLGLKIHKNPSYSLTFSPC